MLRYVRIIHLFIISGLFLASQATADQWPTWRGSAMSALGKGNPPITFSETNNIKWKVEFPGQGDATPVIWDQRIFLLAAQKTDKLMSPPQDGVNPDDALTEEQRQRTQMVAKKFGITKPDYAYNFLVTCLDRTDGHPLWKTTVCTETPHEGHHPDHGYASSSPVTDGTHVWCFFGSRGIYCLDMAGKVIWSRRFGRMTTRARFGEGTSPALTTRAVIVLLDHEGDSSIVAMNRATGATLWKEARDEATSWTTPLVTIYNGVEQVIVNGTKRTRSYDAASGDVIWECGGQTENVVPAPVLGTDRVYCASGFRGNTLQAIMLGKTGDLTGTPAVAWEIKRNTPYVPSPLLYDDLLYMLSGNHPKLSCLDARSGELHYSTERISGMKMVYASPVGAGGNIYLASRKGRVAVIKHGRTFEVLAVNELDEGIDASPAIIGDELYLRGEKSLYCIAAEKPGS